MYLPPLGHQLSIAPAVPVTAMYTTYTRFFGIYEPYEYTDWIDESMSWKTTCYIGDWSPLSKITIKGPDALRFFSDISVNSFAKFDIGQAKHVVFCNDDGKVMGEGILMKLAEEDYMFTSGPGVLWAEYMFGRGNYDAKMATVSSDRFILQVQGPNALFVMQKVTGQSLQDIGFMRFRTASIEGREFLALRQGMAGEVGYEMHGRIEDAIPIYNAILEAGKEFGIKQLGGRTKMVNHVEACFPTPSVDYLPAMFGDREEGFRDHLKVRLPGLLGTAPRHVGSYPVKDLSDLYRSPVELGWGKSIKFDHEFIGRAALEAELAAPRRKMVTLVWNSEDVIDAYASLFRDGTPNDYMEMPRRLLGRMETDRVEHEGKLVGATASRCHSIFFRKMLSLCTIDIAHAGPGTEVIVVYGGSQGAPKRIRATVAAAPYKTDNRRVDVSTLKPTAAR